MTNQYREGNIPLAQQILAYHAGLTDNEHGVETPARFLDSLEEMTRCRVNDEQHLKECIKWKTFPALSKDMVVVKGLTFVSLCNHHVLPFMGRAWIGYVPEENVAGLSKFARVVKHFSRRLQVQEELTDQIATFLEENLAPKGVAVVLEAEHLCMTVRGVQDPGVMTRTATMRGVFADHDRTAKMEFLEHIR